jgi:XTP/dITP diphosphohydrolase
LRSRSNRKRLVLATSNPGKLREIRRYLERLPAEFLSLQDIGADEDVEEKGETFLENARLKSFAYSSLSEFLTLAEDSGLEIEHLGESYPPVSPIPEPPTRKTSKKCCAF